MASGIYLAVFCPYEQEKKDFATWEFAVIQCEHRRRLFMASGNFWPFPRIKSVLGGYQDGRT
jgi:hypothetical protein